MAKRNQRSEAAEGAQKVNISMSPDDLLLLRRFQSELLQRGPSGTIKALMHLEARRRGWMPTPAPGAQEGAKS